jgi:hypothetical protein
MSIVPIMLPCDGSKTKVYMVSDRSKRQLLNEMYAQILPRRESTGEL